MSQQMRGLRGPHRVVDSDNSASASFRGEHLHRWCAIPTLVPELHENLAIRCSSGTSVGKQRTRQETAAFTRSTTVFSTAGLHAISAYETGHMSPSSRFAVSWKPRVEYR